MHSAVFPLAGDAILVKYAFFFKSGFPSGWHHARRLPAWLSILSGRQMLIFASLISTAPTALPAACKSLKLISNINIGSRYFFMDSISSQLRIVPQD